MSWLREPDKDIVVRQRDSRLLAYIGNPQRIAGLYDPKYDQDKLEGDRFAPEDPGPAEPQIQREQTEEEKRGLRRLIPKNNTVRFYASDEDPYQ